ncbi:MAG: tyrosine-type recombinase/integrase [Porphyromonadaceae bacterium]|nr:tyrosine-type recombinase/integrase [Porphyromonadaceae bacterium]
MAKHPNGYGSVRKLSGHRRNPYQVLTTVGWENGKQIQKAIGYTRTRAEALSLLSDYNKDPYAVQDNLTFEEVYKKLDTSRKSIHALRSMKTAYKRCGALYKMKLKDIKKKHLQEIASGLVKYSKSTQQEVKTLWGMIFKFGMENDIITKDYSKFVDWVSDYVPRVKIPYTSGQIAQFSDHLLILCYTSMRISEYLSVKTSSIYDGIIHGVGTKTDSSLRDIPIHPKIAEIVNSRLTGVYLCEGPNGKMKYDYFRKHIYVPEMERLGITEHTIHDTRRTFATFASESKVDHIMTKRLMGHKLNDITEDVYTVPSMGTLKEQMNKVEMD